MLQSSWNRCWSGLNAQGDGLALMNQLVIAYEEPQRKYHTLQHLSECISLLSQHLHLAADPPEVEIALWFHDAIYDVKAHDNEAKSANWAVRALAESGVEMERVERVRQHVMATRHSVLPQGRDQRLIVDIDLSILGAAPARFKEYEAQVRAEYSWVPEQIFRQKRAEILEEFLRRAPLYNTLALREAFELQARENLASSLTVLRSGD